MRSARHRRHSSGLAWWLAALVMMGLIWLGSARADGASAVIGLIRGIIVDNVAAATEWPRLGFFIQKTGHFLEYLLLATLLFRALSATRTKNRYAAVLAIALAVSYAILDEWHQSFVPGRGSAPLRDVLIDTAGSLSATIISPWRHNRPTTRRQPNG